ncbi:MAG: diacylglycerol kinase family protein [Candidatus Obscuribacterales bacterium]|nr:diacylglycerol kinase family protein [Candidatus Obscuribacterales bacterium]
MRRATKNRAPVRDLETNTASGRSLINVPRAWRRRVERTSSLLESFYHAWRGLSVAFQGERNLKIHSVLAVLAVSFAIILRFDPLSWALLFLAIGLVLTAEMLNTALERAVDMVTGGEFNNLAKDAKDVAAGAVVCASLSSLAIAVALYLPRFYNLALSYIK